jgi:hypothetical protein
VGRGGLCLLEQCRYSLAKATLALRSPVVACGTNSGQLTWRVRISWRAQTYAGATHTLTHRAWCPRWPRRPVPPLPASFTRYDAVSISRAIRDGAQTAAAGVQRFPLRRTRCNQPYASSGGEHGRQGVCGLRKHLLGLTYSHLVAGRPAANASLITWMRRWSRE